MGMGTGTGMGMARNTVEWFNASRSAKATRSDGAALDGVCEVDQDNRDEALAHAVNASSTLPVQ
jgi:hypothetical protein